VRKLLPNAQVVADRFHVMKIVNQDLDTARKTLLKANEENPDESKLLRI
jgi:transposase